MAQLRSQAESVDRHVFASMAYALGLQHELITNPDHDLVHHMELRDPDVAYLYEPSHAAIRMRANDGSTCDANTSI